MPATSNLCGIIPAQTNFARLIMIKENETCYSLTPSTGVTTVYPASSFEIIPSKDTTESNKIQGDGQIAENILLGFTTDMKMSGDFSLFTFDELVIEASLRSVFSKPITGYRWFGTVNVATVNTVTINEDITSYAGSMTYVKLFGFTNPENNVTIPVTSITAAGGVTTITTTATLVPETGTVYSTVLDASDVLVMSSGIRMGTNPKQIDSNGANAFAGLAAAFQLRKGQTIHVYAEAAYETGSIQLTALPTDGDYITIKDKNDETAKTVVFEFDNDNIVAPGRVQVAIGVDIATTISNLVVEINKEFARDNFAVAAVVNALNTDTADLRNGRLTGGNITVSNTAGTTLTQFANGDPQLMGFFTVDTVTDDVITVEENISTNATPGKVIIKGSHCRAEGLNTINRIKNKIFYTAEVGFTDVDAYSTGTGLVPGGVKLSYDAQSLVGFEMEFKGRLYKEDTVSALANAPYTLVQAPLNFPVNTSSNVTDIIIDGQTLQAQIDKLEVDISTPLRERKTVGSPYLASTGRDRLSVKISMDVGFATNQFSKRLLDHGQMSFKLVTEDDVLNQLVLFVPSAFVTKSENSVGGPDQDVKNSVELMATRSPLYDTSISFDRFSSIRMDQA